MVKLKSNQLGFVEKERRKAMSEYAEFFLKTYAWLKKNSNRNLSYASLLEQDNLEFMKKEFKKEFRIDLDLVTFVNRKFWVLKNENGDIVWLYYGQTGEELPEHPSDDSILTIGEDFITVSTSDTYEYYGYDKKTKRFNSQVYINKNYD
jgi:hypothetical protein